MKKNIAFPTWSITTAGAVALMLAQGGSQADRPNLVKNPGFEQVGANPARPADYDLRGDTVHRFAGTAYEVSSMAVALDSSEDRNGDGKREGAVVQDVPIEGTLPGRWFRFQIRGLPEDGFCVAGDDLHMKVEFFGDHGRRPLDGVTRKIYSLVEQERRDLAANGVGRKGGAATWRAYAFEFRLPFPDIDQVRLIVGFRGGEGKDKEASFFVDEFCLEPIIAPADSPGAGLVRPAGPAAVDRTKLVALGGRWSYLPASDLTVAAEDKGMVVTQENADRLVFQDADGRYLNPFAANMSAWLRKGYLDLSGKLVENDEYRPDNVTIRFDATSMIVHARNLPNHPTAKFPSPPGSGDRNPHHIQEHDYTYRIPLNPEHNPSARAMDLNNANRALPMGAIGIATNGVVFYNPFDLGMQDATDLMDRCCGHPSPDNRYHYHKYPVCLKSPFADEGKEHSPPIGWAFDGYAIYGPYEAEGVMAKDAKDNPLNDFNVHRDPERGWHYHVTPGKFPYIIGGFWGKVDARNLGRGGGTMAGPGPGGPRGPGGPPGGPGGPGGPPGGPGGFRPPNPLLIALDRNGDQVLSADEIANAPKALLALDRDADGILAPEELHPLDLQAAGVDRAAHRDDARKRRTRCRGMDDALSPESDPAADLADRLKAEARRLGFDQVGIAAAVSPAGYPRFLEWLQAGHAAGMEYMERHAAARAHPDRVLEGVRSVVVVSFVYGRPEPVPPTATQGKVARYARGADYHRVLWRRLESLLDWLLAECPEARGRAVADTAPLLERDFAQLAGLGWVGKNTMLIDRRLGSFTVLGALLVDADLRPDKPHIANHCGTCTRCLDACPTDAFAGPYQLDSRRCISYWTIEHKGAIQGAMAGQLGDWAFGCDICQDVCPWNRKAPPGRTPELDPRPEWTNPDLIAWLSSEPAVFRRSLKGTALERARRTGLVRNAALVLGQRGAAAATAVPALIGRLDDPDAVIRGAAAWALGRIATSEALAALEAHPDDPDMGVCDAVATALAAGRPGETH